MLGLEAFLLAVADWALHEDMDIGGSLLQTRSGARSQRAKHEDTSAMGRSNVTRDVANLSDVRSVCDLEGKQCGGRRRSSRFRDRFFEKPLVGCFS